MSITPPKIRLGWACRIIFLYSYEFHSYLKGGPTDEEIKKLWEEFEDVLFIEDKNSDDSCGLVLASDWKTWKKGTSRDTIWRWFDQNYSKGLQELMSQ